jgi:bifunctional N-acetylglucosamine-1-phosphate-uridyltransferase/glucosamine-1-phosphate-acetyltransferase GlmU-like protein
MKKGTTQQKSIKNVCAVVLAAGKGSRMQSELPKILHAINGKPLILYPLHTLQSLNLMQIITVVKHKAELVLPFVRPYADIAYQGDEYGTAKAVEAAVPHFGKNASIIMVVNGDDSMFYEADTFREVLAKHQRENNAITFITLLKENPTGYGRVLYDKFGNFKKIVEEKDATLNQKKIKEVNDGVYVFDKSFLTQFIGHVKPSETTGEYYLTDLINFALKHDKRIGTYLLSNSIEFYGISTQQDVQRANQLYAAVKNN